MDKLKRYLGLGTAILLLALACIPVDGRHGNRGVQTVTPLAHTVLTRLTVDETAAMRIRVNSMSILGERETCLRENEIAKRFGYGLRTQRPCAFGAYTWHQILNVGDVVGDGAREVAPYEPAVQSLLDEYVHTEPNTPRQHEIDERLGAALDKYLEAERPKLVNLVWAVHAVLVLFVAMLVWGRYYVGAVIFWPFSMLVGAGKASAKAAKTLHDKV